MRIPASHFYAMTLFEKLTSKATKAAVAKAYAKGLLRCPSCGAKPSQAPVDADTMLRCGSCGVASLPTEWRPDSSVIRTGHPDEIPPSTRIQRERTSAGDCVWDIPASGKFGSLMFFGVFWTGLIATATGAAMFGDGKGEQDPNSWLFYPVVSLFWAVGVGLIYVSLRNKYARHQITVTRDLVTLRREMFGRVKEKSLVTAKVSSVAQVEFYQQNYQPIYGVEIRGREGKLRFGTTLEEAEKIWLAADIKRAVFGETQPSSPAANSPAKVAAQRQSSFSFPLPAAPKGHWILGVVFLLMGIGAIAMGISHGPDFPDSGKDGVDWFALVFELIFGLASLIPIIVGVIFGGLGVFIILGTRSVHDLETRLEGDEAQVALRTYRQGRIIKEKSFPREAVSEVRATNSGSNNGKAMKRIDLIVSGKAQKISMWTEGEVANVWVADVSRALGK